MRARAEAAAFAEATGFLDAARETVVGVYATFDRSLRANCDAVEALAAWRTNADRFDCAYASGRRYDGFRGIGLSALDPASPLAAVRRTGAPCIVASPLRPLHHDDGHAIALPFDADADIVLYLALARDARAQDIATIGARLSLAAAALRIAYEREEDRARATFDGLTGLLTPRSFRLALAERLHRAARHEASPRFALLFVDTDRFKELNDRYGHAAGDRLLRYLAELLRSHATEPGDLVARNGGDEFCVVWAHCERSSAIVRAEALRLAIESLSPSEDAVRISASIGIAAFPADATSPEELLECADAAMYAAKRAGRNRVAFLEGGVVRVLPAPPRIFDG